MEEFVQNARERDKQLYDQLAKCDVSELKGIVSLGGVAAGRSGDNEPWELLLSFDAWKIGSGPVRTESLTVRRKVTDDELEVLRGSISAETIITIRARVAEENSFGSPQAQLEELIDRDSTDVELQSQLVELQKPISHEDNRFGTLYFDRQFNWYCAEVSWNGKSVDLTVHAEEPSDLAPALSVAHELWDEQVNWSERVFDYAVQELLQLKNDHWLDDGEADVSPDSFKNKMTLQSVSVHANGDIEFWHDDGDLFLGHSIQICGNLSEGLSSADIPG